MPVKLRIATFNVENLDDKPSLKPTLSERIALMRPQLIRINADILCLQEVNGQKEQGPARLQVLEKFLAKRVMVPCERTIPEPARFSLLHHGKGAMLDHILVSRSLLEFYRHTEIHNELLHDESFAFATDILYPESDHAPVIAEFALPDG
jgi:exonuclease III